MKSFSIGFNVFKMLIVRDMQVFKKVFLGKQIDTIIWVIITIFVNGYLMTQVGVQEGYGAFILIGAIVSMSFFQIYPHVFGFCADLLGSKNITYDLILPIPAYFIFIKQALIYALRSMCMSLLVLPLGKLILWSNCDLSSVAWLKLLGIFISANVFFGFFTLLAAAFIKDFDALGHLWPRVTYPMWFLGSYLISWQTTYSVSKWIACFTLLNPVVYAMEGMRSAAFGGEGYLPYWLCLGMLWIFSIIAGWIGIKHLSKRLDVVR